MQSKAATVAEYLASLTPDRRDAIQAVREVILKNLDKNYVENMSYGMICYCVPHSIFPQGYHCDPRQALPFAGLASQKGYMSVYLMCIYGSDKERPAFERAWAKTGKKLDMGKSCIRFKKVEDLALDVIGDAIRRIPAAEYIRRYENALTRMKKTAAKPKPASKPKPPAAKKPPAKKPAPKRGAKSPK